MALDLGGLRIALELDRDPFTRGLALTKRELEGLPLSARRELVKVSRAFDEEGRKSGGVLAKGINAGLIRNSPLIAAGVAGALAVGAPAVLAGAGVLFGGIGALAAAQTDEVREAWTDLGHDIREGAVQDAAVLVPVYAEMAEEIGRAFQRMRPELRQAFTDTAPLVESFTDGVVDLAENAMPGLVRAVAAGQPVFTGLEHFLGTVGYGVTEFLDALSSHGPAAGSALASLGDITGDLLPILGELLGQGVELASDVLPAVAAATGLTLDVLQALGPALPAIVTGFAALKIAGSVAPMVATLAQNLAFMSYNGGGAATAAGKASTAIAGLGRALPLVALAFGAFSLQTDVNEDRIGAWTRTLILGGDAADRLRERAARAREEQGSFGEQMRSTFLLADLWDDDWSGNVVEDFEAAQAAARESADAQRDHARASAEVARQEEATAFAIQGATLAMIEQAAQALASIDSGFAYQHSLNGLEDAQAHLAEVQAHLNDGNKDTRTTTEEVERAQLALAEQNYRTALAFGQQQADLSGLATESDAYKRLVQEEMLRELHRLHDAAGPEMQGAIAQQIAALEASGVTLTGTAAVARNTAQQMRDLGLTVTQIPGNKTIFIDAPTAEQKKKLEDLGLRVMTLPNGKIFVTADTAPAEGTIEAFMNRRRTIQIAVSANPMVSAFRGPTERAEGGPVWPNHTFLVGERGPELVRFAGPGHVFNAQQTASMMGAAPAPRVVGGGSSAPRPASPPVTVNARIFVGDREITDIARVEATAVVDQTLGQVADTYHYAGGL